MTASTPFEDVTSTSKIDSTQRIGEDRHLGVPTGQPFSTYMQEGQANVLGTPGKPAAVSPFDLAHGPTTLPAAPTFDTLLGQVNNAQSTMGDVNSYLSNPNLKLKQSSKYLLKNKLTDANTHMRTAATHLGAQTPEEAEIAPGSGPIARFVSYVTNGQNQLEAAKHRLADLKNSGQDLKPADFLLVQIQLNLAQQSLEYSSVVLSKAMDDIKMLMNIQL